MKDDVHAQCRAADKIRSDDVIKLCMEIDSLTASLRQAEAENAEMRADLVWAARHQAALYHDTPVKHVCFWVEEEWRRSDEVECDGTDAGICAAVRSARKGE